MSGTWWQGTRLIAVRALRDQLRARTFKVVTGLLLLLSVAGVALPQLLDGGETAYTLATVGQAPNGLLALLEQSVEGTDVRVRIEALDDPDAVRAAVRDEQADAGLAGGTLYTARPGGGFALSVAQAAVALETARRLGAAGLTDEQVAEVSAVEPPEQVVVGGVEDSERAGAGFAVGVVLYLAITFAGTTIGALVAMEKSTRISEVLLTVVRPAQVMVGTVLAVGAVTLLQLLVLLAPLAVAVLVTDAIGLPAVAAGDLALALVWFLLGFLLYSFAFAATAALVDKATEVGSAVLPVTTTLVVGYLLGVLVVAPDPSSAWSVALSVLPVTAPLAMPIRWAAGEVPLSQLLLAMALTLAAAVVLVAFAARVYRRGLLVTGRRATLREVVQGYGAS